MIRSNEEAIDCIKKCLNNSDVSGCFIDCAVGDEPITEARNWIKVFKNLLSEVSRKYGFIGVLFSREFGSFIEDPYNHLRKKLFIYTHDLLRGG